MSNISFKALEIPEGNVKAISVNGVEIWREEEQKPSDPWEALFYSIQRGTYKTDYAIGDELPLDLGTEGNINMQIAGFDCDTLAAGGNYAAVSLISKELLNTEHRMNPYREGTFGTYVEGTGAIGGWEKSEMRTYLKNTIMPIINSKIRNSIVDVFKTQYSRDEYGSRKDQTTTDDVWIPSTTEINSSTALYGALFPDAASRVKTKVGGGSYIWWTRQPNSDNSFYYISLNGSQSSSAANTDLCIALGFCVGVGAPLPSAAMLLNTIIRPTAYNPALDDGEDIPDEQALSLITGGEI